VIILASPLAFSADANASMSEGIDFISDANAMQVLIMPSPSQAAPGDLLNITYLVLNNGNSTMMNVSLLTEEAGLVDLNVSILLPGQSAGGIESISVVDDNLPGPIIRTAKAKGDNSLGESVSGENITSIGLINREIK
jgi:hypothetical protein